MPAHALHLITTGKQELEEVADILSVCSNQVIDAVHIREKHRGARELLIWHDRLSRLLPDTAIFINDRVDAAAAAGASGVQLGGNSLPPQLARKLLPSAMRIGCSVHAAAEAAHAGEQGADFVIYGHIFSTSSKEGLAPRGTSALAEVTETANVPVLAIGGINPDNVHAVLSTGCAGIAVMSGVLTHAFPAEQLQRYRAALDSYPYLPRRQL